MRAFTTFLVLTPSAVLGEVAAWAQCGGKDYSGSTACASGLACEVSNEFYSQCVPSSNIQSEPGEDASILASGIDAKIRAKGKQYFGTCTDAGYFSNSNYMTVMKRDFGQVTPENSLKWDATEPSRGQFRFDTADKLFDYASQNNAVVRGHTLLWHSQLPSWVSAINNRADLTTVIQNHISAVAGRYKGRVKHWDVVNEILAEDGNLRDSVFSRVLGEDFVGIAFRAAKAADPNAKLYINDYNLDIANYGKVNGMVSKVNKWVAAGIPIDGIGSQAHLANSNGWNKASAFPAAFKQLATANVKELAITELDIDQAAGNDYAIVTKACLDEPKCVGITVWGVSDATSWRPNSNPLLFDRSYQPKAAYNSVSNALN